MKAGLGCWQSKHTGQPSGSRQSITQADDRAKNSQSADKRVTDSSGGNLVDDLKPVKDI